jgi:hypothetical protein
VGDVALEFRMTILNEIEAAIAPMLNNSLRNYIVPGLTSSLVGGNGKGLVRLFQANRDTLEFITPHSHRFDFTCVVLYGDVMNTIFRSGSGYDERWCYSTINQVCGENGLNEYVHIRDDKPSTWRAEAKSYSTGDTYSMKHTEIHSIKFGRNTRVLFFEGPQLTPTSHMIEPWENGKVIPTFRTEPWMFEKS